MTNKKSQDKFKSNKTIKIRIRPAFVMLHDAHIAFNIDYNVRWIPIFEI